MTTGDKQLKALSCGPNRPEDWVNAPGCALAFDGYTGAPTTFTVRIRYDVLTSCFHMEPTDLGKSDF